jgi:dTDP-4-amino-4,6-dideoxygalactose transaminase
VLTDDEELAQVMRSLRVHGEGGGGKYDCVRIGINGRLDTIQAAVLMEKLKIFPEEILARERIARRYSAGLADVATIPKLAPGSTSVWAQYTIRLAPGRRDALAAALKSQGIPTAIHYPTPLHRQQPYQRFPIAAGGAPVSERLAEEVISLPMHAYLDAMTQDRIIAAVRRALGG